MSEGTKFNVCHKKQLEVAKLQASIGTLQELNGSAVHMITSDGGFAYHTIHPISDVKIISLLRTSLNTLCDLSPSEFFQVAAYLDKLRNQKEQNEAIINHLVFPRT